MRCIRAFAYLPLGRSSGYHKRRNKLLLKTMSVEIKFRIIGNESEGGTPRKNFSTAFFFSPRSRSQSCRFQDRCNIFIRM